MSATRVTPEQFLQEQAEKRAARLAAEPLPQPAQPPQIVFQPTPSSPDTLYRYAAPLGFFGFLVYLILLGRK